MEHPLIPKLDSFTVDQLNEKITELNKKLAIAYRTGNAHLCDQIRMALESYQNTYSEKMRKGPNTQFDDVIDIS
jgi:hypothetical protein